MQLANQPTLFLMQSFSKNIKMAFLLYTLNPQFISKEKDYIFKLIPMVPVLESYLSTRRQELRINSLLIFPAHN